MKEDIIERMSENELETPSLVNELDVFGHRVMINTVNDPLGGSRTELYFPDLDSGQYGRIQVDDPMVILPEKMEDIEAVLASALGAIPEGAALPQLWQAVSEAADVKRIQEWTQLPKESPLSGLLEALKQRLDKSGTT